MKNNLCTFYIVRHGETEWNRDAIVMGHKDSPLTEKGLEQAKELSGILSEIDFDAVYSSDSQRAVMTAKIILGKRDIPLHTSEQLRERNFDRFEGMPVQEYLKVGEESLRLSLPEEERWRFQVEGCVESDLSIAERFIHELGRIGGRHAKETVLVATHGGCIRHFLMKLGIFPYRTLPRGSFANCGYLIVTFDGSRFNVERIEGIKKEQ
ncbi:MAG: histidine phosphatase family protein [bacterium]|nr:histidine phosphatase family protein [bacterium]